MTDHDAELDAMVEQLVAAGLIETFTDDDGDEAMRLTPEGEQVARQLAMTDEDGQEALMAGGAGGVRVARQPEPEPLDTSTRVGCILTPALRVTNA